MLLHKLRWFLLFACAVTNVSYGFGNRDQGIVSSDKIYVLQPFKSYPVIDVHTHIRAPTAENYELAVRAMDVAKVAVSINLSAGAGETFSKHVALAAKYPGRFIQFCDSPDLKDEEWTAADIGERIAQ